MHCSIPNFPKKFSLFSYILADLDGVPATFFQWAWLIGRLRQHEQLAKYIVEASVPTVIPFFIIRKDVNNLYKCQTFQTEGLHQSQILLADSNTIITHDINRVYINIIRYVYSVMGEALFNWNAEWSRWTKDRRLLNSPLTVTRSSTSLSVCFLWCSPRWHPPSSICWWSCPVYGPRW